jgi:hypothetical protein
MNRERIWAGLALTLAAFVSTWAHAAPLDQLKACQLIKENGKRLVCMDAAATQLIASEAVQAQTEAAKKVTDTKARTRAEMNAILAALERLQTKTKVGLGYPAYTHELSELMLALSQFKRTDAYVENAAFSLVVLDAIEAYADANAAWALKFQMRRNEVSQHQSDLVPRFLKKYPALVPGFRKEGNYLELDAAIGYMFAFAGTKINAAEQAAADALK